MKTKEYIFIGLIIIICLAGHFYPYLGLIALAISLFILSTSLKKKRNGCKTACPRSVFLDKSMKKVSMKNKLPLIFKKKWFEYLILALFVTMLTFRLSNTSNLQSIGYVFVFMCSISTTIAMIMGFLAKPKSWCTICPVGTSQDVIWKQFGKQKKQV